MAIPIFTDVDGSNGGGMEILTKSTCTFIYFW